MGCYANGYTKKVDFDIKALPEPFHLDVYEKLSSSSYEEDRILAYDYLLTKVNRLFLGVEPWSENHISLTTDCVYFTDDKSHISPSFRLRNWPQFELRSPKDISYIYEYVGEGKTFEFYESSFNLNEVPKDFSHPYWVEFEEYLKSLWEEYPDLIIVFG